MMVIEIRELIYLLVVIMFSLIWVFYGLYLRGMIWGRYNELKGNKNLSHVKSSINFLKVEYFLGILWLLGITKIPKEDKKLKSLIFKQRVWFVIGIIALIFIFLFLI